MKHKKGIAAIIAATFLLQAAPCLAAGGTEERMNTDAQLMQTDFAQSTHLPDAVEHLSQNAETQDKNTEYLEKEASDKAPQNFEEEVSEKMKKNEAVNIPEQMEEDNPSEKKEEPFSQMEAPVALTAVQTLAAPEYTVPGPEDFDEQGRCITIMPDPQGRANSGLSWATGSYVQRQFICGMTDADFFGVWDPETENWRTTPRLNYSYFSEDYGNPLFASLEEQYSEIETAVKEAGGDYSVAKELLLEYYRAKERILPTDKINDASKEDHLRAELYMDNYIVHINEKILDVFEIDNTEQYWKSDVTDGIQKQIDSGNYAITMLVAGVKKDGSKVAFQSVNAEENKPYLEMKVNGVTEKIYPTDDTYLSAGTEVKTVHGKEDTLLVKNSGKGQFPPVDEETAKTVLRFDFSSCFRAGDTFENAILNLYGSNVGTEGNAKLTILCNGSTNWSEDTMNWTKYENYDFSYDGSYGPEWSHPPANAYPASRYREELFRMSTWISKLIGQYNVTGQEKYAFHAVRYIMSFIYNRRADWDSSLDMAVRGQYVPAYISQLLFCEAMTPERFTAIVKWMYGMAEAEQGYNTTNNWGIMESSGKYTIMLNYPELAPYERWTQRIQSRMLKLMDNGLKEDGSSIELSLGYADYWTEGVADFLDKAKRFQVKVILPDEVIDATHQTTRYILDMMSPGGGDPQQADSYNYKSRFQKKQKVLDMADLTGDEILRWLNTSGKEGEKPDYTSKIYPIGKKVALRSNWTDQAVYMHFNADGGQGSHSHTDDNSIIIMAYGQYLLADPRYIQTQSLPGYWWLKSSKAHNLVEVSGSDQKQGTKSYMGRSELNTAYDFVSMRTENFNQADKHTRNVLFVRPNFFIVNDYVQPSNPSKENTFYTYWHFDPAANHSFDPHTKVIKTHFNGANLQIVPMAPELLSAIADKDGYYAGTGNAVAAKYVQTDVQKTGTVSMTNILYPNNVGDDFEIDTEPIELDGMGNTNTSAGKITVKNTIKNIQNDYIFFIANEDSAVKERSLDHFRTDGRLLLAQEGENNEIKSLIMQDTSAVTEERSGIQWVYSKNKISELSAVWMPSGLSIDSSKELDLTGVTFYHPETVKKVTLNGEAISFKTHNGYVYFGEKPILEGNPQATSTPTIKPAEKPGHGSSGGGGTTAVRPSATPTVPPVEVPSPTAAPESVLSEKMKKELENHWGKKEITDMVEKGIVKGDQEGLLNLFGTVTRAEFAALITRGMKLEKGKEYNPFSDVASGSWYEEAVCSAAFYGLMQGDGGLMHPERVITREEMAKILVSACQMKGISKQEAAQDFDDSQEISPWAREYVEQAVALGIMKGISQRIFEPKGAVKRDQAIVAVYRMLKETGGDV